MALEEVTYTFPKEPFAKQSIESGLISKLLQPTRNWESRGNKSVEFLSCHSQLERGRIRMQKGLNSFN